MTASFEDRLRDILRDMADEAVTAPLLQRLEDGPSVQTTRRRLIAVIAAAAVAAMVAATSYVLLRSEEPGIIEPIVRPPKVFRLSGVTVPDPGPANVAVMTAQSAGGVDTAHLHRARGEGVVSLAPSEWVPSAYTQQLSLDGTRLVRQYDYTGDPRLEVVNLVTGAARKLANHRGFCPQLSPDNQRLAMVDKPTGRLVFLDVRTGRVLPGSKRVIRIDAPCRGIGFSPDGRLLAFGGPEATLLLDVHARTVARLEKRFAVNSHMSWSPDGRSLLMYDSVAGSYVVHDVESRVESRLRQPPDAVRPLGWAGRHVVWLAGQPGDYRLLVTDQQGQGARTWMRFEIGNRPIETVNWSRDLSGSPGG